MSDLATHPTMPNKRRVVVKSRERRFIIDTAWEEAK
jgi:hypothetical protein